jgi:hypothetical protein
MLSLDHFLTIIGAKICNQFSIVAGRTARSAGTAAVTAIIVAAVTSTVAPTVTGITAGVTATVFAKRIHCNPFIVVFADLSNLFRGFFFPAKWKFSARIFCCQKTAQYVTENKFFRFTG